MVQQKRLDFYNAFDYYQEGLQTLDSITKDLLSLYEKKKNLLNGRKKTTTFCYYNSKHPATMSFDILYYINSLQIPFVLAKGIISKSQYEQKSGDFFASVSCAPVISGKYSTDKLQRNRIVSINNEGLISPILDEQLLIDTNTSSSSEQTLAEAIFKYTQNKFNSGKTL